jgi:hypothetical protein
VAMTSSILPTLNSTSLIWEFSKSTCSSVIKCVNFVRILSWFPFKSGKKTLFLEFFVRLYHYSWLVVILE